MIKAKEKAIELYENLIVYDWHEEFGYIPNEEITNKKCLYVVDLMIQETKSKFWYDVARQLKRPRYELLYDIAKELNETND